MGTVLLILKIIGIILLGLLGFILTVALLVVFYPVSYRLRASYEGTPAVKLKVHWLFHLISVTLDYEGEKKKCIFRLCGIPLMDFLNPKPKKEKKPKSQKKAPGREKKSSGAADDNDDNRNMPDKAVQTEPPPVETKQTETDGEETAEMSRLEAFRNKVLGFFQRIKEVVSGIIRKIRELYEKGINLKEKLDKWIEVLEKERTRQALDKVKHHIMGILKHIMPRKWKAVVLFGFEDPALTGKIMGYYWMFIGLWGEHLICTPDFEQKVFRGTAEAKGHIQVCKFLYVAYKFLFDKDLVYLRKIKEEVDS